MERAKFWPFESGKSIPLLELRGCVMRNVKSEADLREWLRKEWQAALWGPLIWVEAARGGTVGAPDVFIPIPGCGYVPVELKFWPRAELRDKNDLLRSGVVPVKMRPAQRRLHTLIGVGGYKSVVVAYVGFGEIGVGVGWRVARFMNSDHLHMRYMEISELRQLLTLASFWREENYAAMACAPGAEQLRKIDHKRTRKAKSRL